MTTTGNAPKPHAAPSPAPKDRAVHLVLSETAGRWELVVHADPVTAETLRASAVVDGLALTLSVHPNLVPGQPFDIASVRIDTDPPDPVS